MVCVWTRSSRILRMTLKPSLWGNITSRSNRSKLFVLPSRNASLPSYASVTSLTFALKRTTHVTREGPACLPQSVCA